MSSGECHSQVIDLLVVDDEERVRKGLKALLQTYPGVRVVAEAGDGADGVARADTSHPHVVLMDVHMPVMDGIHAARHIKEHHPEMAVVLLTIDADMARAAELAGADEFLVKGLPGQDLMAAIRRCRESVRRPPAGSPRARQRPAGDRRA
jgi:DNA-binding NarL/FixJ family response regulator